MRLIKKSYTSASLRLIIFFMSVTLVFSPYVYAEDLVISNNGDGSTNTVTLQNNSDSVVSQQNTAEVTNNVETETTTGDNSASANTNGDIVISTGDSNTTIVVDNELNSSSATAGCCESNTTAAVEGNGTDSENSINLSQSSNITTSINQTATINNTIRGYADTGNNSGNQNSGNVSIETGNIVANGSVINGPVNISNLINETGSGSVDASIDGNGAKSINKINTFLTNTSVNTIYSEANINNFVKWNLNTGNNAANFNNGDVSIFTGDILLDFLIKNGPINLNTVFVNCCSGQNIDDPGDEEEEDGGDDETVEENDSDEDEDENADDENEGEILPEAASTSIGGPNILGLSDTDSQAARALFFWLGLIMITGGIKFVVEEISPKTV